jgi:hypothetical protein
MMQTPSKLLSLAIGNPQSEPHTETRDAPELPPTFRVFDVTLPLPEFRGLPPTWTFVILDHAAKAKTQRSIDKTFDDARAILAREPDSSRVILVSDDPDVHLGEEFEVSPRSVFCLDATDLEHHAKAEPRRAPFANAIRRKWSRVRGLSRTLSPYMRGTPIDESWRFFGRENELEELVFGNENVVIVGARRIGKTSLMAEAERQIQQRGEKAFYVNVQSAVNVRDIVHAIVREVDLGAVVDAARRSKTIGESLLSNTLRRLTQSKVRTTLFIDELGVALKYTQNIGWDVLGVLRENSQHGKLRIVVSCFQEYFLRQQDKFDGPLVNFGHTMRVGTFGEEEIQDFVLSPIEFWMPPKYLQHKKEISELVRSRVGGSPYLLAYFGSALFEEVMKTEASGERGKTAKRRELSGESESLLDVAKRLLYRELQRTMDPPIREINQTILNHPTLKYLYLRRCYIADKQDHKLQSATISDSWIESTLRELGYASTDRGRTNLIDGLVMRGLCAQDPRNPREYRITAPAFYYFLKHGEGPGGDLTSLLDRLRKDISNEEMKEWDLRRARKARSSQKEGD